MSSARWLLLPGRRPERSPSLLFALVAVLVALFSPRAASPRLQHAADPHCLMFSLIVAPMIFFAAPTIRERSINSHPAKGRAR